jgi:hypothetical protein
MANGVQTVMDTGSKISARLFPSADLGFPPFHFRSLSKPLESPLF